MNEASKVESSSRQNKVIPNLGDEIYLNKTVKRNS